MSFFRVSEKTDVPLLLDLKYFAYFQFFFLYISLFFKFVVTAIPQLEFSAYTSARDMSKIEPEKNCSFFSEKLL